MTSRETVPESAQPKEIHLVGIGLGHALTPTAHNFLAQSIDAPWRVIATECPTIADCVGRFRSDNQAGGIVTMPWKGEIMKHLDRIDDVANVLKACNAVYFDEHNNLCGSNTDWIGIEGALRAAAVGGQTSREEEPAAVIGAGGAARAAVYTLSACFGVKVIYVLNRDDDEVTQLINDCKPMDCELLQLKSIEHSTGRDMPSVIIGSIPDFEAISSEEKAVKAIFENLLSKGKGTFLDMCYHPMKTRHIRLAEDHGWQTVSGIEVVGHQVEALWRLWIDPERLARLDRDGLWRVLREAAALDSKGLQALNAEILKQHFGE